MQGERSPGIGIGFPRSATGRPAVDGSLLTDGVHPPAVDATGKIPPGNAPGPAQTAWHSRRARKPKPELRLTPGKGLQDLTISLEELVQNVVQSYKVGLVWRRGGGGLTASGLGSAPTS